MQENLCDTFVSYLKSIFWKKGAKKTVARNFQKTCPCQNTNKKCPNPNILNCNYKEIKQYISNIYEIDPPEYFHEQFQRIHVKNILVTHLETKNEYTLPMK